MKRKNLCVYGMEGKCYNKNIKKRFKILPRICKDYYEYTSKCKFYDQGNIKPVTPPRPVPILTIFKWE